MMFGIKSFFVWETAKILHFLNKFAMWGLTFCKDTWTYGNMNATINNILLLQVHLQISKMFSAGLFYVFFMPVVLW